MRLTGGADRGHPLVSPRGDDIRPTSDRVREALFSILGPLEGERVLDIFAGAGTLGLESISRGAGSAVFVDREPRSLKALASSVERLSYGPQVRVIKRDSVSAVRLLESEGAAFELIFLDPPYGSPALLETLQAVARGGVLGPGCRVIVEHDRDDVLSARIGVLERVDERRYGRTVLSFFEKRPEQTPSVDAAGG